MKYEQQVRDMDDESKSIPELAPPIAQRFGLSIATCSGYLYVKRAGYSSTREYRNELSRAQGFKSDAEQKYFEKIRRMRGKDYTLEQFRNRKRASRVNKQEIQRYLRTCSIPLNNAGEKTGRNEQRVRNLDNPRISMAKSARKAAKKTRLKYQTCFRYISVFRKGITDRTYTDFQLRQKGFIDVSESLDYAAAKSQNPKLTMENFRQERAKKKGFGSVEDHIRFLEDRRLFFQKDSGNDVNNEQKRFEYSSLEFRDHDSIDSMGAELEEPEIDSRDRETFWDILKGMLKPREYAAIYETFYEERTLKEIAQEMGVCTERICQIHAKALRKLRHPCRTKIIAEFLR